MQHWMCRSVIQRPCRSMHCSLVPVAHACGCRNPEISSCKSSPRSWRVGGPQLSEACPGRRLQGPRRRFPPSWSRPGPQRGGAAAASCHSSASVYGTAMQPWPGQKKKHNAPVTSKRLAGQGGATSRRMFNPSSTALKDQPGPICAFLLQKSLVSINIAVYKPV